MGLVDTELKEVEGEFPLAELRWKGRREVPAAWTEWVC